MQSENLILLIALAPCVPVAMFGWWRSSTSRTLVAVAWTATASVTILVLVGLSVLGDCAEDVIGPVPGNPCHAAKRDAMQVIFTVGIAILFVGNWLIFRRARK